jgi:predicted secreted protein
MRKDKRSGKLALVAHCILNQNSRVLGLAERSSVITEIAEFLMRNKVGIIQMPCPEFTYAGVLRQPQTKDQYDNVTFRRHCRKIAKEIVDQIGEYAKCGINAKMVVGVDGSPSCGVNQSSMGNSCKDMAKRGRVKGSGILVEELHLALRKRKISIPFCGIRYERLQEDLVMMERLLKD